MARALLVPSLAAGLAAGINNGLARTPAMGWSSWYASPGGSNVTDAFVKANAQVLLNSGLAAKGFAYVNVDEGWLGGRYANGSLWEIPEKFPSGMKGLGDWVHAQGLKYGLYTCRGTCQCGTAWYSGPGGQGYEAQDSAWMVAAGADWLKVDSCCGNQDHGVAFADYSRWRDGLNATGKEVWFNLCGWNPWYAPPDPSLNYTGGSSLGNSWRIDGDGGDWGSITSSINVMAGFAASDPSGNGWQGPGGWNDMDNVLGPTGWWTLSDPQWRLQFLLWSIMPTQLVLGADLSTAPQEYLDFLGNTELIAINQDSPYMGQAKRIVGGDLTWPCAGGSLPEGALYAVQAKNCTAGDPMQQWMFNTSDSTLRLASLPPSSPGLLTVQDCGSDDGTLVYLYPNASAPGCSSGQGWTHDPATNRTVHTATGKCLDEYMWTTPRVDLWACVDGATNEQWAFSGDVTVGRAGTLVNQDSGFCLTATPPDPTSCVNIFARTLSNGDVAMAMANNGAADAVVTCDAACFTATGLPGKAGKGIAVRDLLAHTDLGTLTPPYSFSATVPGGGGGSAFRLQAV